MFFISDAYAQGAPGPENGYLPMIVLGGLFVFMYFTVLRPQTKRARELKAMNDALAKGDEVVTSGGVVGTFNVVTAEQADAGSDGTLSGSFDTTTCTVSNTALCSSGASCSG